MIQRKKQIEKLLANIQSLKRKIFFGADCNLKNDHITTSQWFVLQHLNKSEGTTLKEVACSLNMTSSAATQLVEALVQKGYIIRKTSTDDRRELKLMISDKSKKHIKEIGSKWIQELEHIFDVLTDDEFGSYCSLCDKVAKSLASKMSNKS
jgi:DNA-binding MarR family transcriptional regulator